MIDENSYVLEQDDPLVQHRMDLEEAAKIVLDLARENIIDPRSCNEENLDLIAAKQIEAIEIMTDFLFDE